MRTIKIIDSKDYTKEWEIYKRDSVRAIIFCNNNLAMIKSEKYGEYKFPGGGIEAGESHLDALIRETKEETGLHIIPSTIKEYGKTLVICKSMAKPDKIFEQESFYYICDIDLDVKSSINLDDGYETEYNYSLVFASLGEAIEQNSKLLNIPDIPWVKRDLFVLHELQRKSRYL